MLVSERCDVWRTIAARGSTLRERVDGAFVPDPGATDPETVAERLACWRDTVAPSEADRFARRLAWDRLDESTVRAALGVVSLPDGAPLPGWAESLRRRLAPAARSDPADCPFFDKGAALPFQEVYAPLVVSAWQEVAARQPEGLGRLSGAARTQLQRSLLQQLAWLASRTLHLEFTVFCHAAGVTPLDRVVWQAGSAAQDAWYQRFVRDLLREGGLEALFQEYPVLARLLATRLDLWVEAQAEFLERLNRDWSEIGREWADPLHRVEAVDVGLSDPHQGGRSVAVLTFASGMKLVYKPKALAQEEAFFDLLEWLNGRGPALHLRRLRVLSRPQYGWVEFVERAPCRDDDEARAFYRRAGMLLAVLYVLGGTDAHYQNVIAAGEHPVLVDAETLLQHRKLELTPVGPDGGARYAAGHQLADSVLRTGLLPRWEFGADRSVAYDVSGLGAAAGQHVPGRALRWLSVNTDAMTLADAATHLDDADNVPQLRGAALSPADYEANLVAGFRDVYRLMRAERAALLAPGGPLARLAGLPVRFVFRATRVYGWLLARTLDPQYLRDGADRGIELDVLSRAFFAGDQRPPTWPLLRAEQEALERLDVPFFLAQPESAALRQGPHLVVEPCFAEPSYERLTARLAGLCAEGEEQQVAIIRASLSSRRTDHRQPAEDGGAAAGPAPAAPCGREEWVAEAEAIAAELKRRAIRAGDGSLNWIGLGFMPEAQRFQLQPLGEHLYDGATGVALFFAALAEVTGREDYRELARGALGTVRWWLRQALGDGGLPRPARLALGAGVGVGGVVYGLVRLSALLGEPGLLADARQAALLLTEERIAADAQLDVVGGAAGAVLGLLALHAAAPDGDALARAVRCGRHLLGRRAGTDAGPRAWPTVGGRVLAGFSHGAAGIAYALLRLHAASPDPAWLDAAREGLAFERAVFSPEERNWPDLRPDSGADGKPGFVTSWCHGAAGIGLARLGGLGVLDDPAVRQEIGTAIETTLACGVQAVDQLCCGNFGRVELLLQAGARLGRPELADAARAQTSAVLARVRQGRPLCYLASVSAPVYNPGLFQGAAGIGYQLLRLAHADRVPSVLLLEPGLA
jgi:type 2 lantibiotic biosynthesis protein LanM